MFLDNQSYPRADTLLFQKKYSYRPDFDFYIEPSGTRIRYYTIDRRKLIVIPIVGEGECVRDLKK